MLLRTKVTSILIAAMALFFAHGALAVTPAETRLTNTATLDFEGNGTPIPAEVTVTVRLVTAAPSLVTTPGSTASVTQGSQYSATYEIISNANGNDSYDVVFDQTNNNLNSTTTATASPNPIVNLGATAFLVAGSQDDTVLQVPSDSNDGDGQVNGIATGDTVRIDGNDYDVTAIDDQGTNSDTSTITIDQADAATGGLLAGTYSIGVGIREVQSFTVEISNVGTPDGGGASTIDLNTRVEVDDTPGEFDDFDVTITVVEVSFTKYVRNLDPTKNPGTADISFNSDDGSAGDEDFYSTGVEVTPNDTIEYLLVVEVPSGGSQINDVNVDDMLPAFTTYVENSTQQLITPGTISDVGQPDSGDFPLEPTDEYIAGDVLAGETLYVVYQVVINN